MVLHYSLVSYKTLFCLIFIDVFNQVTNIALPPLTFFSINAAERSRRRVFNHAVAAAYRQSARRRRRLQTPGAPPPAK